MMVAGIKDLIETEEEALDVYMAFALLWMAAADGALSREALGYLYKQHENLPRALDRADKILVIIAADDMDSFLLACRGLRQGLCADARPGFLNSLIATAVAPGALSVAANHTLRFLSDLLGVSRTELEFAYRELTQQALPDVGDLSSMPWWEARDAEAGLHLPTGLPETRREAFAILGLSSEASSETVKQTYRRLVQHHHPDRVARLDHAARQSAERKFMQVQQAYELIRK